MKRAADIVLATAGLAVVSPLLPLLALAIKLDSPGPVFFRQERVGRGLRPFRIMKLRTMTAGAESRGPGFTPAGDQRVTRIGRLLRAAKLDELPQLFNVLRGEMSLVGPRPELPEYVRHYPEAFAEILTVRPGITDVASIAYRDEASLLARAADPEALYVRTILPNKIRLARRYVKRASLARDLALLLETVLVVAWPARRVERLIAALGRHHRAIVTLIQAGLSVGSILGALALRYDGAPPSAVRTALLGAIPAIVLVRTLWFRAFGLDRDVWQYVESSVLGRIAVAVAFGSLTLWLLGQALAPAVRIPPSLVVLDALLCAALAGGLRLVRRAHGGIRGRWLARRVLVVGSVDAAERVASDLTGHPRRGYQVLGLVSDDPVMVGMSIHGTPILGSYDDLETVVATHTPDEIVCVPTSLAEARRDDTVRRCRATRRPVRLVPDLDELLAPGPKVARDAEADGVDVLFRDPVPFTPERVQAHFHGRRVMVTGAGGSIGSEICRQVAACAPARLTLFERHEASLYHIERELRERYPDLALDAVIGDVLNAARVDEALERARPEVVFHAAAYKHVPMMEHNALEAYRTNVRGTRTVAEAAGRGNVTTFVLVSTDKAVEPVSVMGASKRLAEIGLQAIAERFATRYLTVRFGNVLESSGSVVPLFREQIARGGPVTVTHAHATRWFMTVPEAVHLMLHAAILGRGGEVFVLDMGRPVRVLDVAHALVTQAGLRPDEDVPIVFTGLRPGERLYEKLFNDDETVMKTPHPRILVAARNGNGHAGERRAAEVRHLVRYIRRVAGGGPARSRHVARREPAHA